MIQNTKEAYQFRGGSVSNWWHTIIASCAIFVRCLSCCLEVQGCQLGSTKFLIYWVYVFLWYAGSGWNQPYMYMVGHILIVWQSIVSWDFCYSFRLTLVYSSNIHKLTGMQTRGFCHSHSSGTLPFVCTACPHSKRNTMLCPKKWKWLQMLIPPSRYPNG